MMALSSDLCTERNHQDCSSHSLNQTFWFCSFQVIIRITAQQYVMNFNVYLIYKHTWPDCPTLWTPVQTVPPLQ